MSILQTTAGYASIAPMRTVTYAHADHLKRPIMKHAITADSLTPRQLADAINDIDSVNIARQRLSLLEIYLYPYREQFQDIQSDPDYDDTTRMFLGKVTKFYLVCDPEFKEYEFLKKYLSIIDARYAGGLVAGLEDFEPDDLPRAREDLDVERAKQVAIADLYDFQKARRGSQRTMALCPFHRERTPSFVIYHDTNSYYCFSCAAAGDSIKFIMDLNGMDFVSAVKHLGG